MKRLISKTILLVSMVGMVVTPTFAGRDIPDNNLAYPVLIKMSSGAASGFYGRDSNSVYLVTACHVLYSDQGKTLKANQAELLSYPADPKLLGTFVVNLDLAGLHAQSQIRAHSVHDVAIVRLGSIIEKNQISFQQGVTWKQKIGTEPILMTDLLTSSKRFNDVFEANEAYIFGYPTSLGIDQMEQIDPERPLLRKGSIAGRNPRKKTLVVDCPVYYGNSGGPVVEVEQVSLVNKKFLLIGVVSQFVPFKEEIINRTYGIASVQISNSGYAIITPMDAVLELLWNK